MVSAPANALLDFGTTIVNTALSLPTVPREYCTTTVQLAPLDTLAQLFETTTKVADPDPAIAIATAFDVTTGLVA